MNPLDPITGVTSDVRPFAPNMGMGMTVGDAGVSARGVKMITREVKSLAPTIGVASEVTPFAPTTGVANLAVVRDIGPLASAIGVDPIASEVKSFVPITGVASEVRPFAPMTGVATPAGAEDINPLTPTTGATREVNPFAPTTGLMTAAVSCTPCDPVATVAVGTATSPSAEVTTPISGVSLCRVLAKGPGVPAFPRDAVA